MVTQEHHHYQVSIKSASAHLGNHDGRQMHSQLQFKPEILTHTETLNVVEAVQTENERDIQDTTDFKEEDLMADNINGLVWQLEYIMAALFLRIWTILNICESAVQDVI